MLILPESGVLKTYKNRSRDSKFNKTTRILWYAYTIFIHQNAFFLLV